jgi:PTH1 family peptidyl-tRNA hydrolase
MTRHNIGFHTIDYIADKYGAKLTKLKFKAVYGEATISGEKVYLVKPQTYMNLSGDAVIKLKNWYKVDNNDILVIYDDFDIPFESVRYRDSGSAGTHNGMKDIVNKLATKDIPRLRIGTGGLKKENQEVISFVLSKFSKDELDELNNVFEKAYLKFKEFLDK